DLQEQNIDQMQKIDQMQEIDQIKEVDQIPATFNNMNDVLEVCNWLIKHPHILKLASQMHIASLLPVTHASEFGEPSNSLAMSSANTIDNRNNAHLWDEETKCLFLQMRNPPSTCIDEFIKRIFGYLLYSNEGKEIEAIIKKALEGITVTSLLNKDIKKFIDENVVSNLLKQYISGTNKSELKRCRLLEKLVHLIREMFRIHWREKNIVQVKNLDNITKNMHIPSKSGLNIASKLNIN
ncbi:20986_t:CDS:2, partial [Cetraspora pellucida]